MGPLAGSGELAISQSGISKWGAEGKAAETGVMALFSHRKGDERVSGGIFIQSQDPESIGWTMGRSYDFDEPRAEHPALVVSRSEGFGRGRSGEIMVRPDHYRSVLLAGAAKALADRRRGLDFEVHILCTRLDGQG